MEHKDVILRYVLVVIILWLMSMACSSTLPVRVNEDSRPTGSVIYASDESGNFELYLLNVQTRRKLKLTDNTSEDITPFYFSLGQYGFISDKSGKYAIYTVTLENLEPQLWKENEKQSLFTPSVSPDGSRVAYVVEYNPKSSAIFLADFDGKNEERLTNITGLEWDPAWSPDGEKIAFSGDGGGSDWEVNIINLEDGKVVQLTNNTFYDGRPRWSPDGSRILFDSDRDGDWELYVMDADGSNTQQITENRSGDWGASWSSDGNWIVYVANYDGDDDIFIVGVDGTHQMRLTENRIQDRFPIWLP